MGSAGRRLGEAALVVALVASVAQGARADGDGVGDGGWRPREAALELGVATGMFLPSDEHELYDRQVGEQEELTAVDPELEARVGLFPIRYVGAELEGGVVFANTVAGGAAPILFLRASAVGQLPIARAPLRMTPFLFAGVGNMWVRSADSDLGNDRDRVWHAGAGVKAYLSRRMQVRLDGRWYYTNRLHDGVDDNGMVSHWGLTLGATWELGGQVAGGGEAVVVVERRQREVPRERIARSVAATPREAPDEDGDGVSGAADRCPDEPEDPDGFADEDGCPELDNDQDAVVDGMDGCPVEAGVAENLGCPDRDRDGDTVVDRLDNCPDEKGTAPNQGCVRKQLVVITQSSLVILDRVHFASGKARILPRSHALLDNVAQVVLAHPQIALLRVEGHTDDRGDDAANKALSQSRAESVRDYLIGKGVEPQRLEAVGLGEERPISDNATRQGKADNRRVEFHITGRPAAP